jgi:hypothetical protein
MAKIAKTKSTGGYGYKFEDKVAAVCLLRMLDGQQAFDLPSLPITKVYFQTRALGWLLDDLLLELKCESATVRCAISIKSAAYLTTDGFRKDFVQDLWNQWRGSGNGPFDPTRDYLALATGKIREEALSAWQDIESRARLADPEHLAQQLTMEGSSSAIERSIFRSLLPEDEAKKGATARDSARLMARLYVAHVSRRTDSAAIRDCASELVGGTLTTGKNLWEKLQTIASNHRVAGGAIELSSLLGLLRGEFQLNGHPDYEGAWKSLNDHSFSNCEAVRAVSGVDTRIDWSGILGEVASRIVHRGTLAITGESGIGKSSILRSYVRQTRERKNLIWLSGQELHVENQSILARKLGLATQLPDMLRGSSRPVLIVADAIEQFSKTAHERLAELVIAARESVGLQFSVLITAQPLRWEQARIELESRGLAAVTELPFAGPKFESVVAALAHNELVRPLLARPELRRVVTNLATLDQILKTAATQKVLGGRSWIGETEIIDWVWKGWIGIDRVQHQRGALLRFLGEEDGDTGSSIPLSRIPYETTELLGDPEIANLTRTDASAVRFIHEVVADWARYHSLKAAGPSGLQRILELIQNPRWTRAIRLFSQSLLESEDGLPGWERAFASFQTTDVDSQIAADVFSDSLVLATNSEDLLERVWPALIADGARRLKRLMKRIMIIATVPLPVGDLGEEYREAVSVAMRVPIPSYWDGLLNVLSAHADEVATDCIADAGEVSAFYLRVVPAGYGKRQLVSRLVLKLAAAAERGRRGRRYRFRDASKSLFEAILRAGTEFPDEAGHLALLLAERLPDEESEAEIRSERIVRSTGISSLLLGELREPWPDGPRRRVENSFQDAVLSTDALSALMVFRPSIAREVLLAVCIEEPQHDGQARRSELLNGGGFAYWDNHMPAMYFTGPFLRFLQLSPEDGLTTILRLVDFATNRWQEGFIRIYGPNAKAGFTLYFDGFDRSYAGDGNVYKWHRSMRMDSTAVESALMALEKWLYDRIDAKQDIAHEIERILSESTSAAFLGLLVAVGLYSPELFKGPLKPLLSSLDIFMAQHSTAFQDQMGMSSYGLWARYGKKIVALVEAWHKMQHRSYDLFAFARFLLLNDEEAAQTIEGYRKRWVLAAQNNVDTSGEIPTRLASLIAQLDRSNYSIVDVEGGKREVVFRFPDDLESRLAPERPGPVLNLSAMNLPGEARRSIDGSRILSEEEARSIFARLEQIVQSDQQDGTFEVYRPEAVAAGAALLVICGSDWLSHNPSEETFCWEMLRRSAESESVLKDFDSPQSVSDEPDLFVAEAALFLLKSRMDDWLWTALLRGVTSFHYETAGKVMQAAFRQRSVEATRFPELVGAIVLWSAVRVPITLLGHRNDAAILEPYRLLIEQRFRRGYFKSHPVNLGFARRLSERFARWKLKNTEHWKWHQQREAALASQPKTYNPRRRLYRDETYLDLELLAKAFVFLGQFDGLKAADRGLLRAYFNKLLELELDLLPDTADSDSEEFDTQYDFDHWVMALCGVYYAKLPPQEALAEVAAPVMSLGAGAHRWIRDFLHSFFRHAPSLCENDADLAQRWRALIHFTYDSPRWDYSTVHLSYPIEQLACEVMGFSGHPSRAADAGLQKPLALIEQELLTWCGTWLELEVCGAAFARFVASTSSRRFVQMGLVELARAMRPDRGSRRRQEDLTSSYLAALTNTWNSFPDLVRTGGDAGEPFHKLLTFLTALLIPEALDLQTKVAQA